MLVFRENLSSEEINPHVDDPDIRFRAPTQFEQYRLITGHFSLLTQIGFCRNRYSITMLRDPIQRIFSNYKYYRVTPGGDFLRTQARGMTFSEFVRYFQDSPKVLHNCFCYHFAGVGLDITELLDADELLGYAKHNLAAFDFVGLMEEFGRSVNLLCHELSWRPPAALPHENRSADEITLGEIDPETLSTLRERNQLDLILYEYARELFHKREAAGLGKLTSTITVPEERNRFVPFRTPLTIKRRASFSTITANWLTDESPKALGLEVNFTTSQPAEELNLIIMIRDARPRIVYRLNTRYDGLDLQYGVGLRTRTRLVLECILPAGAYVVSVGLSDPRRLGFHEHWIDSAVQFTVLPCQVSAWKQAHKVCLRRFESIAYRLTSGAQMEPETQRCMRQLWNQGNESKEASARVVVLGAEQESLHALSGRSAYRPQAVLNLEAKLCNPQVHLKLETDKAEIYSSGRRRVSIEIRNLGNETLSTRYTYPVMLSYHWLSDDGTVRQHDGLRSALTCDILPGDTSSHEMIIGPPPEPRCTLLSITLVQELVCWFDDRDPNNRLLLYLRELEALTEL